MSLEPNICDNCTDCTPEDCPITISCDGCLLVSQPTVLPKDSVAPCGQSAFVTIDYVGCDAVPTFTIMDYDTVAFTNVYFSGQELHYDTTSNAVPGEYYDIRFKASCASSGLETQGILTVGIKDLCSPSPCTELQDCNPCDASCVDRQSDLYVDGDVSAHSSGGAEFV